LLILVTAAVICHVLRLPVAGRLHVYGLRLHLQDSGLLRTRFLILVTVGYYGCYWLDRLLVTARFGLFHTQALWFTFYVYAHVVTWLFITTHLVTLRFTLIHAHRFVATVGLVESVMRAARTYFTDFTV